jgi:NAD(P)-dependent dehydrogenase (short-subunit alcohol dehydrogenase family)
MQRFANRVAIVTGATSGIGRETALCLAREGAQVIATGRNEALGAATVAAGAAEGLTILFHAQDVSAEAAWIELVAWVESRFGRLDVLVNNAGQFMVKPLCETSLDAFDALYRVNVQGCWLGMKHAMTLMARGGGGAIVNVASLMGLVGYPQATAYCASKGAMTALTKAAAVEGRALNIRVNSLHPGVIWTKMLEDIFGDDPAIRQMFVNDTPLRLEGTPAFMADGILYLASDDALHVTGAELTIDGGRGAD